MTPQEHAEVWNKAASVVAAMDPMRVMFQGAAISGGGSGMAYTFPPGSMEQSQAYRAAAGVLYSIARQYSLVGSEVSENISDIYD